MRVTPEGGPPKRGARGKWQEPEARARGSPPLKHTTPP